MSEKINLKKYMRQYGKKSLLVRNAMIVFLFLLIPFMIICVVNYVSSQNEIQDKKKIMVQEKLNSMIEKNDTYFQSVNRLTAAMQEWMPIYRITYHQETIRNLSTEYADIMGRINEVKMTHLYIDTIVVYSSLNDTVITPSFAGKLSDTTNMGWVHQYIDCEDGFNVKEITYNEKNAILAIRRIKNAINEKDAYVFVVIDKQMYGKSLGIINDEGLAIFDKNNKDIIFCSQENGISKNELDNFSHKKSERTEWNYYYNLGNNYFDIETRQSVNNAFIMGVLLLFLCAFLAYVLSVKTFKPIQTIMQKVSNNSEDELLYNDMNEIAYITRKILGMDYANRQLSNELEQRTLLLNNAQIYALQYQINPHFVFNTLETIKWMIYAMEPKNEHNISGTMSKLSKIFKYSLDMTNYFVNLETEIENTKNYIAILQTRYQNLFNVKWDIDESLYSYKIVKLSLQPLVENAVYHGLKVKGVGGVIKISAYFEDGNLCLSVHDNGVGMDKTKFEELCKKLESSSIFSGVNIGLSNLNNRIKIMCGDEYGLELENEEGFTAKFRIPQDLIDGIE